MSYSSASCSCLAAEFGLANDCWSQKFTLHREFGFTDAAYFGLYLETPVVGTSPASLNPLHESSNEIKFSGHPKLQSPVCSIGAGACSP